MKTLLLLIVLLSFWSEASTIGNFHQVDREGLVFRGREPKGALIELLSLGITDVIIFKNEVKDEVRSEMSLAQVNRLRTHHIPFRWKEIQPELACEQVIEALSLIRRVTQARGKVFFHCTVGEDRTGLLAGLFVMNETRASLKEVFRQEMCARGYADGNPAKPPQVVNKIERELTPLFEALARELEQTGKITKNFCKNLKLQPSKLKCRN